MPQISRSIHVAAPAPQVWALVSDLPGMGSLSPENTGGRWVKGATGPVVGARFRGTNRNGWRRWSTNVRVTHAVADRAFAFSVSSFGIPVSDWSYDVASDGDAACTVTESWVDRRPGWFRFPAGLATGVRDRGEQTTAAGIDRTLAAVKARLER